VTRAHQVVWVSDLKYVTTTAVDGAVLRQLSESGGQREWYVYPKHDDLFGIDVTAYAAHDDPLIMLNAVVPKSRGGLSRPGLKRA
jgi:hypothetical protein